MQPFVIELLTIDITRGCLADNDSCEITDRHHNWKRSSPPGQNIKATMSSSSSPSETPGHALNRKVQEKLPAAVADAVPHIPETKAELKEEAKAAASSGFSQLRSLAAGGFGGVCAVVVGHPFDLVKVRLQTAEKGVYSSAVDVVRKSIAKDGLRRGLYAGVSAPLVGVTPMCRFRATSGHVQEGHRELIS